MTGLVTALASGVGGVEATVCDFTFYFVIFTYFNSF